MTCTSTSAAAAAVARVAAYSSGAILLTTRASATSPYAATLEALQDQRAFAPEQLEAVPQQAELAHSLVRLAQKQLQQEQTGRLATLLAVSDRHVLTRFLPYLSQLINLPIAIHVALPAGGDHSDVLALRSSGLALIYSSTAQQAQAHAIVASKAALGARKAVLHFFELESEKGDSSFEEVPELDLKQFFQRTSSTQTNGRANGHANGNGHSNGSVDGTVQVQSSAAPAFSDLKEALLDAYARVTDITDSEVAPYTLSGDNEHRIVVALGRGAKHLAADFSVVEIGLVRPSLLFEQHGELLTKASTVAVLEKTGKRTTRLGPVFTDIVTGLHDVSVTPPTIVGASLGHISETSAAEASAAVTAALESKSHGALIGALPSPAAQSATAGAEPPHVPKHEKAYHSMLEQVFDARLHVVNSPADTSDLHPAAHSPEYAFGQILADFEKRDELVAQAQEALRAGRLEPRVHELLTRFVQLVDSDAEQAALAGKELASLIAESSSSGSALQNVQKLLPAVTKQKSRWIIGSDAWAYDTGMSGVHHVIASGKNVNMLIFDTLPYTKRDSVDADKRKKDIGLYAMNYGNAYVASTAVYADYTQVLHALQEADRFNGPSIVLAYVPFRTEQAPALEVLKETKLAIDSGYWPLFRWDPSAEARGADVFRLDGARVREQLKQFLDRQNHLSYLSNAQPQLSYDLAASQGSGLLAAQKRKAKQAYDALLSAMDGPPLLLLYASDGGNAEKVAKKLGVRARARGLAARVLAMDDFPVADELKQEKNVAFVTSTAGQGEFPQNGRETWKTLNNRLSDGIFAGSELKYAVFGMGDSHYWPRPEDAHYYNKSGKDLDARLSVLGAERMIDLGLGDDQDADGWQTGYNAWESLLWKALSVDSIEVKEAEPEPITNEHMKIASNYLRGTIREGLADTSTGAIAEADTQLTKFHGTYMQYDRDTVEERKAAGLEPAYSFMIRCRIPGGVATPQQWLQLDDVAEKYGNQTLKITTRQTLQYHCIVKSNLKAAMQGINKSMLDTIAACGDVNRNVMCTPLPSLSQLHEDTFAFSKSISEYLLPRMNAYHEIWLDKGTDSSNQLLIGGALKDYEPLYGPYYLPRKFKIAIAVPPRNDTDCFAHDIGLIAIADPKTKRLAGFNLSVGGGMGVTHSMKITYPRLGDVIGFVTPEQTLEACKEVMLIQRDTGNRTNRKQARLKYTIDKYWKGPENFRAELERRLGFKLEAPRPYKFTENTDRYGWYKDHKDAWHCGLWLENGRVKDTPEAPFRTGLRELAKFHKGHFRMTPNQHIIVSDVSDADKPAIVAHLKKYKMDNWNLSGLQLSASACVAFPTCGLAMAESERYLPVLVEKVERLFLKNGLRDDEVTMRMSGCANGCSRPWLGEIGFVGKAPGSYLMLLGGGHAGQRLNKIFRDGVGEKEILELLEPMIARYAQERITGEAFGDWVIRAGIIAPTTSGAAFYDNVNTDGFSPIPAPKVVPAATA
ncbi:putative sulfite reductase cys-4 [Tilletiaria anomala UBC 951]|uniref:assimilatory sulfite reductase (NADPH) n=1 Tax=Tilletiaria anomala (strain ATCC 24038 / CBS 436.72 / UBC 951) TaxID=1037660 RepID=A0A066VK52_TILAU|nr:putative sulfite reductase cys-4 [Tilletiaria anomala UBC 951]KDN40693.1 putative sulfite reductase cys-4 [Tilletiaria anomala UBC 951]